MFHEKQRRRELDPNIEITFVMVSGDGGMDIGMGSAIGTAVESCYFPLYEIYHGTTKITYDPEKSQKKYY